MALSGERLLIAATIDEVNVGELFNELPLHLPVLDHFSIEGEQYFDRLTTAMDNIFATRSPLTRVAKLGERQGLYGAKLISPPTLPKMPARQIENINRAPWYGLRALAQSIGEFDGNYAFKDVVGEDGNDTFVGYIADTNERQIKKGDSISFASVALIAVGVEAQKMRVIKSILLRRDNV
jgi:hypothetical protein